LPRARASRRRRKTKRKTEIRLPLLPQQRTCGDCIGRSVPTAVFYSSGIAIKRPLSTLKVTAFRGQASVKVLSMICRWTLEQCGQVKVRKSRPESHGSIAVSFICESQAVHCGPLFCASSMGVASSPMVADGRAVTDRSCHHAPPNTWVNFARSRNLMNCIAPLTRK
jgi:hypothetical protein